MIPSANITPPSSFALYKEIFGVVEFAKLLMNFPDLAKQPKGKGESVMVIPGYGTSDRITSMLRLYLKFLNYTPMGWGLGRNNGKVPELLSLLVQKLLTEIPESDAPINLIGWSLGGYLARELAREHPAHIRRVITLGAPVVGGPKYTVTGRWYKKKGYDLDEIEKSVEERNRMPLNSPVTAIYSKNDNVVAWQACIDESNPHVEHVEVHTTHAGLGFSPNVYRIIAERLAEAVTK